MSYDELLDRVSIDPNVCGGKPCVRGTRIYIAIILGSLAEGVTPAQIVQQYPQLAPDDVHAALAYALQLPSWENPRSMTHTMILKVFKWVSCPFPSAEFSPDFAKRALIRMRGENCQGTKQDGSPCGWAQRNPRTGRIPLQLDHVNGDPTDSGPCNVRLLCPNCHTLTPTYAGSNRGRGRGSKKLEQGKVNSLIAEVARLTGRTSQIEKEGSVNVFETLPGAGPRGGFDSRIKRRQRFRTERVVVEGQ